MALIREDKIDDKNTRVT